MEIARTTYSGLTSYRLAVTTGVLGMAAFPTTVLILRLHSPEPKATRAGCPFLVLMQLSAGAFAYRWHPACTLLPLGVFGLYCITAFGPKEDSAGKKLPHIIVGVHAFMIEYFAVVVHLTAAARGLGRSNRFFKIAAMAAAGVGQAALAVIGVALLPFRGWQGGINGNR
jgi:hypothetical protein